MQNIINILVFLLILGSIVTIHEFGHFIAAKLFGVYCGSFSIGMGPKLFSHKGKETTFEIRALPIGGFVTMAGETDQDDNEEFKDVPLDRTLKGKKTYQKVIIFLAGVFMNFVLAIVVMFALNICAGTLPVNNAQIGNIDPNSAAEIAGLQKGDIITQIDVEGTDKKFLVSSFDDIPSNLNESTLHTTGTIVLDITIERNNATQVIKVTPKYDATQSRYVIGITQATRRMNFVESFTHTFTTVGTMSVAIFDALSKLITNFTSTVSQLSGPVGIYKYTAEVTQTGQVKQLFYLLALLSTNIGIFNLLPIPGLDGCQVIFVLIERVIGREMPQKAKLIVQFAGLALVMLLMVFVTFQDILRLFG